MCLRDLLRLVEVDGDRAVGERDGTRVPVSLAVLTLQGVEPEVGDWIVAVTGLAVERLTADEAATVRRHRARLGEPTSATAPRGRSDR